MNAWLKMLRTMLLSLFLMLGAFATVSITGCEKEGPLEEAAEEIEDEIDDATD